MVQNESRYSNGGNVRLFSAATCRPTSHANYVPCAQLSALFYTLRESLASLSVESLRSDLKTLLQQRGGKWLATSSNCREKDPPVQQYRPTGRRKRMRPKKTWRRNISRKRWESAGSPVTEIDGDLSSPNAPRETGGTKSKY